MSEAGGNASGERLAELAKLTAEYAGYSRTSHGIALVVFGVAMLAVAGVDLAFASPDLRLAYFPLPLVWLAALHASRGRYQRHGVVISAERPLSPRARRWIVGTIAFGSTMQVARLVLFAAVVASRDPDRGLALAPWTATVAALVALVPVLAATIAVGRADALMTLLFTFIPWGLVGSWNPPVSGGDADRIFHLFGMAISALMAVAAIVEGARQHARYRRLERRLAALREPA